MTECCPTCHAPYKASRIGIRMPLLKAELFDSIKMAGEIGISTQELLTMHYQSKKVHADTIKSHVHQINDLLVETDYQIYSDQVRPHPRWYLKFRPVLS